MLLITHNMHICRLHNLLLDIVVVVGGVVDDTAAVDDEDEVEAGTLTIIFLQWKCLIPVSLLHLLL